MKKDETALRAFMAWWSRLKIPASPEASFIAGYTQAREIFMELDPKPLPTPPQDRTSKP